MPAIPLEQVPQLATFLRDLLTRRPRWQVERDAASCLLGLNGLRIHEVTGIKVNDLRPQTRAIRVHTLKGGRNRTIPIDPDLWASLQRLAHHAANTEHGKTSDWLFHTRTGRRLDDRNLRRRWHQFARQALGRRWRFHDLRHTAALWLYEETGHELFTVQRVLGHTRLENTALYIRTQRELAGIMPAGTKATDHAKEQAHPSPQRKDSNAANRDTPGAMGRLQHRAPTKDSEDPRGSDDQLGPGRPVRPDRRSHRRRHRRRRAGRRRRPKRSRSRVPRDV